LVDFDTVEESNIASQGYFQADLGKAKVEATGQLCRQINPDLQLHLNFDRFKRTMKLGNCVFSCVDSIQTRKLIWDAVKDKCNFFVDGRMTAEVLRILTAADTMSREHYPTTLFSKEEAFAGSCTAKTTIYCTNIAAGLILSQFTKYLRGFPIEPDIQLNLLASELTVGNII
jgi:molybdopterin-synthase adenylyltransferase